MFFPLPELSVGAFGDKVRFIIPKPSGIKVCAPIIEHIFSGTFLLFEQSSTQVDAIDNTVVRDFRSGKLTECREEVHRRPHVGNDSGLYIFGRPEDGRLSHAPFPCLLYTSPSPRDGLLSRMPS